MTARDLKPHLRKCKNLVLGGARGGALAKALGVSIRTTNNYINQLVYLGELIEVKGSKRSTPRAFIDGKVRPDPFKIVEPMSQTDENIAHSDPSEDDSKRVVGGSNNSENFGRPNKMVNFHCTGAFVVPVITLGEHGGVIRDDEGYTIGEWSDVSAPNGSRRQYAHVRLFPGESMHCTLYMARSGDKLTTVPQPRDVYYKTAETEGPRQMYDQVYTLLNFLVSRGWKFGPVDFAGEFHIANRSPDLAPLLKTYNRKLQVDDSRVFVDSSHGTPEIETSTASPTAYADQITLTELPERIESITDSLMAIHQALITMAETLGQLSVVSSELTKNQVQTYSIREFDGRGYL